MPRALLLLALVGCPKKAPEPEPPTAKPDVSDHMQEHFVLGTTARDAVIDGDVETAKKALLDLSEHGEGDLPAEWKTGIGAMKERAYEGSKADSLESAALAVAEVAQACGYCHDSKGGPSFSVEASPPLAKAVVDRMDRHEWAAARMWEGLVQPSEELFLAGAQALSDAPLWRSGDNPEEELPSFVAPMEERVRKLAGEALEGPSSRVTNYGSVLATCAGCHFVARDTGAPDGGVQAPDEAPAPEETPADAPE